MKQSSKIELLNRLNNKLNNITSHNKFSLTYSKDALKYMEILYIEGKILSFKKEQNKLIGFVNSFFNSQNDKIVFENQKYKPALKYNDVVKIQSSLKTIYFHTSKGCKTLEEVKKNRLGGVPIFVV